MVNNFTFLCLSFPIRPYHRWLCDSRQATPASLPTSFMDLCRHVIRTILNFSQGLGSQLTWHLVRPGNWAGGPAKICESEPSEAEVKAYERQTEVWTASLHLGPCGDTPCSSSWCELAFQPGLCKQPLLHSVFLAAPSLCAGNNPINCIIAVERRRGNGLP